MVGHKNTLRHECGWFFICDRTGVLFWPMFLCLTPWNACHIKNALLLAGFWGIEMKPINRKGQKMKTSCDPFIMVIISKTGNCLRRTDVLTLNLFSDEIQVANGIGAHKGVPRKRFSSRIWYISVLWTLLLNKDQNYPSCSSPLHIPVASGRNSGMRNL